MKLLIDRVIEHNSSTEIITRKSAKKTVMKKINSIKSMGPSLFDHNFKNFTTKTLIMQVLKKVCT